MRPAVGIPLILVGLVVMRVIIGRITRPLDRAVDRGLTKVVRAVREHDSGEQVVSARDTETVDSPIAAVDVQMPSDSSGPSVGAYLESGTEDTPGPDPIDQSSGTPHDGSASESVVYGSSALPLHHVVVPPSRDDRAEVHPARSLGGVSRRAWIGACVAVTFFAIVGVAVTKSSSGSAPRTRSTASFASTVATSASATSLSRSQSLVSSASGGTVTHLGGLTVKVPAGALDRDTTVTVTALTTLPGPLPDGVDALGTPWDVTLGGAATRSPLTLTLPITERRAFDELAKQPELSGAVADSVFLAHWTGAEWEILPVDTDLGLSRSTASVRSFSPFVLVTLGRLLVAALRAVASELTSGAIASIVPPACGAGTDSASHWEDGSVGLGPLLWCSRSAGAGVESLEVVNRRRYGITLVSDGTVRPAASSVGSAIAGQLAAPGSTALGPGESAHVEFPAGATHRVTASFDGMAQLITTFAMAAKVAEALGPKIARVGGLATALGAASLLDAASGLADHVACGMKVTGFNAASPAAATSTLVSALTSCLPTSDAFSPATAKMAKMIIGFVAFAIASRSSLVDQLTGAASQTLTYRAATTSATAVATTVARTGPGIWTPVGSTRWTPGADGVSGTIDIPENFWGGIRSDVGSACSYRLEGDARLVTPRGADPAIAGFGFTVRAHFVGEAPTDGQGIQYEPALQRVRNVDYTRFNDAPNLARPTDDSWHHLTMEVRGASYTSLVDGQPAFTGTMNAPCGGAAWIRVWQAQVEVRNLAIERLDDSTAVPAAPGVPRIDAVSAITSSPTQEIVITGSGFGAFRPIEGALPCLSIYDLTGGWEAGHVDTANGGVQSFGPCDGPGAAAGDLVTAKVTEWSDNRIRLGGFGGAYGDAAAGWVLRAGDTVRIRVANAQSGAGPAEATITVIV